MKKAAILSAVCLLATSDTTAYADDTYGTFVLGEDNWQFQNYVTFFGRTYTMMEEHRSMDNMLNRTNNL